MREYEDAVNRANARERALKLKEYCMSNKQCERCEFWIGTCSLSQHPCNWDLNYRRNDNATIRGRELDKKQGDANQLRELWGRPDTTMRRRLDGTSVYISTNATRRHS